MFLNSFFMKKIVLLLMLTLCGCVKTIKVKTTLEKLPTIDIQTYFEEVKLQPVDFVKCENYELCLTKENAENLYLNIKALKEHINYVKASYTCDIKAYKEIVNR